MSRKTRVPSARNPDRTWISVEFRRTAWNVSSRVRTRRGGRRAGVRSEHPDPGERHAQDLRQRLLQPVRVLDAAPDGDAVPVGGSHERVGLDGEMGHHRERPGVLDDEIGGRGHGVHVTPTEVVFAEDVRPGQGVAPAEGRVLHQRGGRVERCRDREDGRQLLVFDVHENGGLLGGVLRVGGHGRHGLPVVLRLVHRQDRAVLELGSEARHGLRQIGRGHDQPDAGHLSGRARVDRDDPGARTVERDELHMEHVREVDVGHVLLLARDALLPADARGRCADPRAHRVPASAAAMTASVICR
jgi:hypothetical protein